MKHGLRGSGVVITSEEAAEVERRLVAFEQELRPEGELEQVLVQRAAQHSVRLDRCVRHETAMVAGAVRHAATAFDEARSAEVAALADRLATDPETSARQLRTTREGIAWMIDRWESLRGVLNHRLLNEWTTQHAVMAENLMGRRLDAVGNSRVMNLSCGVRFLLEALDPADGAGLDRDARRAWARQALDALIGAEIDGLREAREAIDPELTALDRAEAADRALFDVSPQTGLSRRYEAAAERGLYRALRELKEIRQAKPPCETAPATTPVPVPEAVLGSFGKGPEPEPEPTPEASRPIPVAASRKVSPPVTPVLPQSWITPLPDDRLEMTIGRKLRIEPALVEA